MTDYLFWRHAEAEDMSPSGQDADRALTRRGRKDAAKMAKWLNDYLPANAVVLCSPALRCQQTLAALAEYRKIHAETVDYLSLNGSVAQTLSALESYSNASAVLLVGHQPNLGYLIARLLQMQSGSCVVKKGALWWLRQRTLSDEATTARQTYLFNVQHPDYL